MVLCVHVSRDHPRVAADHELLCTDQGPLHHPSYTPVSPCQHCTDTHHWPQWSCNPPEYPEHVHQLPGSTTQCLHQSDPPANHWRSLHEIHIQWCHWMSSTVDLLAHRCLQVLEMNQMNIYFTSAGKRIGFSYILCWQMHSVSTWREPQRRQWEVFCCECQDRLQQPSLGQGAPHEDQRPCPHSPVSRPSSWGRWPLTWCTECTTLVWAGSLECPHRIHLPCTCGWWRDEAGSPEDCQQAFWTWYFAGKCLKYNVTWSQEGRNESLPGW